jgi:hypothetical protein
MNFLEDVKDEAVKDDNYKDPMKSREKNDEHLQDNHDQQKGVLYHCTGL